MNKKLALFTLVLVFAALCVSVGAYAATSDALQHNYYFELYGEQYPGFTRPYTTPSGEGVVDATFGSLTTTVEDYHVYGKNGFDVSFIRSFNTSTSAGDIGCNDFSKKKKVASHYEVNYECTDDGAVITFCFDTEKEIIEAGESFTGRKYRSTEMDDADYNTIIRGGSECTYVRRGNSAPHKAEKEKSYVYYPMNVDNEHAFVNMKSSMKVSMPSVASYDYDSGSGYRLTYVMFQDFNGETNSLALGYDTEDDIVTFDGSATPSGTFYSKYHMYAVDENDISVSAEHDAGFTYNMYLLGDDGTRYYVNRSNYLTYHLVGAEDRFGNVYRLAVDINSFSVTTPEDIVYTCDSSGITKTENGVVTELVSYSYEDVNNDEIDPNEYYTIDDEHILTIRKNSSDLPEISDDEENTIRYYMNQDYRYENVLEKWQELRCFLPYKIEFPSGLSKHIEYEEHSWSIGFRESASGGNQFSVSKYYETDGSSVCNYSEYQYEENETASKINSYLSSEQTVKNGNSIVKIIKRTFDEYKRLSKERVSKGQSYVENVYTYYGNKTNARITENAITQADGGSMGIRNLEYSYIHTYYPETETDGDYVVNYTYHTDGNYIPHEVSYQKDADTVVKTQNILTPDKKAIAQQNTYENDTLVRTVSYTYDSYGNIASQTVTVDGTNTSVTRFNYTYTPDGGYVLTTRTENMKDADGGELMDIVTTSVYDANRNLISNTDANGNITAMTYDRLNRPLTVTHPDGGVETYSYDIANGITTYTAQDGTVYKAYFDPWGNRIKTIALVDGAEIKFDEYEYDSSGNISSYKAYEDNNTYTRAEYTYDYLSRPLTENVYNSDNTLVKTSTFAYTVAADSEGRPLNSVTATLSGDNGTYASESCTTNYRGYTIETKVFDGNTHRVNTFANDYVGNVLTATDAMGNVISTTYDAFNNPLTVTYADGSTVSTAYNGLGLVSSQTDARGNTTQYTYDAAGRNIMVVSPFDDETSSVTKTYYDSNGNVTANEVLTEAAGETQSFRRSDHSYDSMNRLLTTALHPTEDTSIYTRYTYDLMGNPTKVVSGLPSADSSDSLGEAVTYTYDALGRMVSTTTPDNLTETTAYDNLGRITHTTDKSGRLTSYTYDSFGKLLTKASGGESVSYTYNLLGLPLTMTDSSGTTTYAYSPFGELTTETKGGIIKSYSYDSLGRRTAFNVTNNGEGIINQTYAYDALGRLTQTAEGTDIVTYTYDANSNLLTKAHNGSVYHTAQYNKANLPVLTQLYSGNNVEDVTAYTYTPDGNLTMSVGTDVSSLYYYDGANRLVHESTWGSGMDYSDDYTYDSRGNRTQRIHSNNVTGTEETTGYTYNAVNQLVAQTNGADTFAYAYDTVGNMTSVTKNGEQTRAYTYDAFNRLISANVGGVTSAYAYNGNNLRQTKTVNGVTTTHIYDGADIVADLGTTNTVFVRGVGLALLKNGTTTQVYGITPRGDVSKLMLPNGTTTDYTYTAYGEPTGTNEDIYNPFGYTGEYTDSETGLVYLRNRYYDPEIGRFLSEDTHWNPNNMIYGDKEYKAGEIKIPDMSAIMQSSNLYAYCMNNPMNYIDPTGQEGVAVTMLWDAFFGGGSNKDYSYNQEIVRTFYSSPNLNKIINTNFEKFKKSGLSSETYSDSVSFYGNDLNPNDLDLHLAVGLANYSMTFTKETVTKRFLWITWKETVYNVKVTVSDKYNFDNYREGQQFSDFLNNLGYDWQKNGSLKPYYWSVTFSKKGLE